MSETSLDQEVANAQQRALDLAEGNATLHEALGELVRAVEALSADQVLGSILILDAAGKSLRHGAAPSLPAQYCEAIDGIVIGPTVGSCGTAAFSGSIVMVRDIANDPLWTDFKDLALAHGLRSCWSSPIRSPRSLVLGTFALYHREITSPTIADRQLVSRFAVTAADIIERSPAARAG